MQKNLNITKFNGEITCQKRESLHGHASKAFWFTGLSASGKSTIAHMTEQILYSRGCSTYVFDGDNVRHGLCSDLGFTESDRAENIRRIGEMINLFLDAGIIALAAFISPFHKDRQRLRNIIGHSKFIEVFVDCPIETCIERDPKGIYKQALAGEIKHFTGISSPYEPPENPDIIIQSDTEDFHLAAKRVADYILS